ncbi:MAG: hypothetical protein WAK35_16800, partial [Xanthobacteraceae bacterium]
LDGYLSAFQIRSSTPPQCPPWVIRRNFAVPARCPFSPQLPTYCYAALSAAMGQIQTFGTAGKAHLFYLLSGAREN